MSKAPIDVATQDTVAFLGAHTDFERAFLEVGCGSGDLAAELVRRGSRLLGIDLFEDSVAACRAKGVDARQGDFLQLELPAAGYDCVVFARSLHHIEPVESAVEKTFTVLAPGGLLLLDDFAVELIDERSLAWLRQIDAGMPTLLRRAQSEQEAHHFPMQSVAVWNEHHFGKHHVLKSSQYRPAIARIFAGVEFEPAPYLYRYLVDRLVPTADAALWLSDVLTQEQAAIAGGDLTAVGLRAVAAR